MTNLYDILSEMITSIGSGLPGSIGEMPSNSGQGTRGIKKTSSKKRKKKKDLSTIQKCKVIGGK